MNSKSSNTRVNRADSCSAHSLQRPLMPRCARDARPCRTAPGHVEAVRALVLDPLTMPQVRQLTDIGRRIMLVVNPNDRYLDPSR